MEIPLVQEISPVAYHKGPTTETLIPSTLTSVDGDRAVALLSRLGDMVIHCTIAFEGQLDPPRLARALRLLMDQEPAYGAQLKTNRWWQPIWERREDLDTLPLCTLVETSDVAQAIEAYMVQPYDVNRDPPLQARLIRDGEDDTLCLKASHCVADACGVKETMYLLARLYQRLGQNPALQVAPNLDGDRSFVQLLKHFSWQQRIKMLWRNAQDIHVRLFPLRRKGIESPDLPLTQPVYVFRHLTAQQGAQLQHLRRIHGATLNDLVVTALARGIARHLDYQEGMQLRLTNTVDLRRYLPHGQTEAICNLSSFSFPSLGPWNSQESFAATLEKAKAEMDQLKQNLLGTGDVTVLRTLSTMLPFWCNQKLLTPLIRMLRWLLPPAFTNMGRIEQSALCFEDAHPVHGWLTASVVYPPFFIGGVSGFGNRLTLSAGFCANAFPREDIEALLDGILSELTTAAAATSTEITS